LGNECVGTVWAKYVVVTEEGTENIERRQRTCCGNLIELEIVEIEAIDARPSVSEVGVDLEAVHITNNKKRWVSELLTVVIKLFVCGVEVFVLALVLPGEVIAEPDVGGAFPSVNLRDGLLKRVSLTNCVSRCRMRLTKHVAEINEMRLRTATL
jgi:hypothetical protein